MVFRAEARSPLTCFLSSGILAHDDGTQGLTKRPYILVYHRGLGGRGRVQGLGCRRSFLSEVLSSVGSLNATCGIRGLGKKGHHHK